MKSLLALATVIFALSFCNLMGRRANRNENANSRSSGSASETGSSPSPARNETETSAEPRREIGSAPPPASQQSGPGSSRDLPPPPPPATPKPLPKTISGGVLNGKAISKPQPAYPPIARAAHASGLVTVQVLIDEKGNVVSAHAVSGHPLLQASAVAASWRAKFSPTLLSGQSVKVTGVLTYNFVAQ